MEKNNYNNKIAVILFNLGGPDSLGSVRGFLYNLFSDKYILRLPFFIRKPLAYLIAKFRYKSAQENYNLMGGKSPLLDETIKQSQSLKNVLKSRGYNNVEIFISMRYWHPFSSEVVKNISKFSPDTVVYLPLYPQFSSTTTKSSFEDFDNKISKYMRNSKVDIKKICCFADDEQFIMSHQKLLIEKLSEALKKCEKENLTILFSAHSLPKKIVDTGDPYQFQIEKTVENIMKDVYLSSFDYKISYQSKVGPIEWLSPSTEDEIKKYSKEKRNLVIVPIAFVSEHIETLVELDIEYSEIAKENSIIYERVPALGIDGYFINSLASLVEKALKIDNYVGMKEKCGSKFKDCPCNKI